MKLTSVFVFLFASISSALNLFTHHNGPRIGKYHMPGNTSGDCTPCLCVAGRLALSSHHNLLKRSHKPESSISPPTLAPPNSNGKTNNTQIADQESTLPSSLLTLENLITVVFRAVITVLTIFNVNITWRIHGKF